MVPKAYHTSERYCERHLQFSKGNCGSKCHTTHLKVSGKSGVAAWALLYCECRFNKETLVNNVVFGLANHSSPYAKEISQIYNLFYL